MRQKLCSGHLLFSQAPESKILIDPLRPTKTAAVYYKFWLIMAIVLSLAGCGANSNKPMPKKFQPIINHHPKYFMTVKGHIAPSLIGEMKLVWVTTYYSTNPKCEKTINPLEGVTEPQMMTRELITRPNKSGIYNQKLVLDQFKPGFCDWKLRDLYFNIGKLKNNLITGFWGGKRVTSKISKLTASCIGSDCVVTSFNVGFNQYLIVPMMNGLTTSINVYEKKSEK